MNWYTFGLLINPANYMAFLTMDGYTLDDPMKSANAEFIVAFMEVWG